MRAVSSALEIANFLPIIFGLIFLPVALFAGFLHFELSATKEMKRKRERNEKAEVRCGQTKRKKERTKDRQTDRGEQDSRKSVIQLMKIRTQKLVLIPRRTGSHNLTPHAEQREAQ